MKAPLLRADGRFARRPARQCAHRDPRPALPRDGRLQRAVQGIVELKEQYAQAYGATGNPLVADVATNYVPNIPTTYWTFRLMIGVGMAAAAIALAVLWLTPQQAARRRTAGSCGPPSPRRSCRARQLVRLDLHGGRAPAVDRLRPHDHVRGRLPRVSVGEVITSMVVFTLLYGPGVVEIKLFLHYVRREADPFEQPQDPSERDEDAPLVFAY